ncbi:MAG: hypothetical protein P8186_33115 [Anaerolineae bacterium]
MKSTKNLRVMFMGMGGVFSAIPMKSLLRRLRRGYARPGSLVV